MTTVTVENFVRAETARMFDAMAGKSTAINTWHHVRAPTPLDQQSVIRMNRDTLYSAAVVDISEGAQLTMPDTGDRYQSVMVVNEDHHINGVLHGPGTHSLNVATHGTPFVLLSARTLADPTDDHDLAEANACQDGLAIEADANGPWRHPEYDAESLDATRTSLLELAQGLPDADRTFGRREEVDPIRHLLGTAYGWGGLPTSEAFYYVEADPQPAGAYTLTLADVPVDAFWSVSVYNRDGFFEPNPYNAYSVNSVTGTPDEDGSFVLTIAPADDGNANYIYSMDGWNYVLRLYRPKPDVLDRSWTPPKPVPAE